jgi:hypothetical protein
MIKDINQYADKETHEGADLAEHLTLASRKYCCIAKESSRGYKRGRYSHAYFRKNTPSFSSGHRHQNPRHGPQG